MKVVYVSYPPSENGGSGGTDLPASAAPGAIVDRDAREALESGPDDFVVVDPAA
jgi:hypothetical protein